MTNEAAILKQEIIRRNLAPEESLSVRELSMQEINKMHSKVLLWHEMKNNGYLTAAIEQLERQAAGKKNMETQKAKRMFSQKATPTEIQETLAALNKLAANYPQLIQIDSNSQAIITDIRDREAVPSYEEMVHSFEKLTLTGTLTLAPENIKADTESEVTGYALRNHPNLPELLEAHPPLTAEQQKTEELKRMSADEFKKYAGLENTDIPPLVEQSIRKAVALFKVQHPEYAGDNEAQEILLEFIYKNNLPVTFNSLELAYVSSEKELRAVEAIDDLTRPTKYGVSTLIENPVMPNVPVPVEPRSVRIADSTAPRKWTPQEIQAMDSTTYQHYMEKYPEFRDAVDEYFG